MSNFWEKISRSPANIPATGAIPWDHVVDEKPLVPVLERDEHYFQVRINQMHLAYSRRWFKDYDPMVFVVSQFTYKGKGEVEVPFVVGPSMMEKYGQPMPAGMKFSNTRVAGIHPYRGNRLNLSVVLSQVSLGDHAKKMLQLLENAAKVLDISTALSTSLKIADVVLNGFETLLGLGDIVPLAGLRNEYDSNANDRVEPGYFVLINLPDSQIDLNKFWVQGHELYYGSQDQMERYHEADFVLYSLMATSERDDDTLLPFYSLYKEADTFAKEPNDGSWESVQVRAISLWREVISSPDLTRSHSRKLAEMYKKQLKETHDEAVNWSPLGPGDVPKPGEEELKLREALNILKM